MALQVCLSWPRMISIHALREEGDCLYYTPIECKNISIHALREEGDLREPPPQAVPSQFLSTPSARRATPGQAGCRTPAPYFYPRPPRGGRLAEVPEEVQKTVISIHALREEGDLLAISIPLSFKLFLSTPSARRATSSML